MCIKLQGPSVAIILVLVTGYINNILSEVLMKKE